MKLIKFLAASAAVATMLVACNQSVELPEGVEAPTAAEVDSVSYLVGINFGYFIKSNNFGKDLNFSKIEKGMMDFINAEGNMQDPEFNEQLDINPELMNRIISNYVTKKNAAEGAINTAEGKKFLAKNKLKDGVVTTESGLQYKIIEQGSDKKAGPTDAVTVNYKGTLLDGTVFDETKGSPIELTLNRVIKGWAEGLQLVGEGGKIELYIPSELGYGAQATGAIKANSTLIFEVEVVKVGKDDPKVEIATEE